MSHPHAPTLTSSQPASAHTGHAVEVVATFGDAVVGVRHVADPTGGVVKATTRALLAGGAALLASSVLAFGYAASVAADNAEALERWTAAGKPEWAFRPVMVPGALDALMLGGSFFGLAAVTWGLSRRRRERLPAHVRLGTARGVDFACEGVGEAHDLIAPAGDGFAFHPAPGMAGELVQGGVAHPLAGAPVAITPDTRLRVKLGATTFHVGAVPAPAKAGTAPLGFDSRVTAFMAASAIAHLGLVAMLRTVPSDQETGSGTHEEQEVAMLNATAESQEELAREREQADDGADGASTGEQARMTLASGTMGSNTATPDPGRRKVASRGEPAVARIEALQRAKEAGILGYFQGAPNRFASVTGDGDITSGFDDLDQDGGWDGDGPGSPYGFGNGPNGVGPGGGGNDWNSVWSGNYNTISTGPGTGDEWGLPGGNGKKMRRTAKTPPPKIGEPTEACKGSADCDPSIIKRYIKRNASKIAYCYERQLLATPGLAGTVDTLFTVMPNGTVMSAKASGVHEEVSSCIADVISSIRFPKFDVPFQVRYPFHLRPAGT